MAGLGAVDASVCDTDGSIISVLSVSGLAYRRKMVGRKLSGLLFDATNRLKFNVTHT